VLGVSSAHVFRFLGQAAISLRHRRGHRIDARPSDWKRLSAGDGTKGRGCMIGAISNWPISMQQFNNANDGLWTRGLLIRRRIRRW